MDEWAYKFAAGMGDTLMVALYQYLVLKGVDIQFFHKVEGIDVDKTSNNVSTISVRVQAETISAAPYQPLKFNNNLKIQTWPKDPQYDQLKNPDGLKGLDLESYYGPQPGYIKKLVLGTDFDDVVLGISLGAFPSIFSNQFFEDFPQFGDLVKNVGTVQTLSMQCWFNQTPQTMGWDTPTVGQPFTGSYINDFNTMADMVEVTKFESWGTNVPQGLSYFCGPMKDDPNPHPFSDKDWPDTMTDKVFMEGSTWLQNNMGGLYPNSTIMGKFNWNLLISNKTGPARLDDQYWRANVQPTERYVQSLPGTMKYRIDSANSGISNLYLAGDWTANFLNVGSAEAATTSGLSAGFAIIQKYSNNGDKSKLLSESQYQQKSY